VRIRPLTSWLSHRGGGVAEALRPLAGYLAAEGVVVTVFGLADPCAAVLRGGWGKASIETVPSVPPRSFGYAPALAGLLECSRLDLIHLNGLWMYHSLASLRWSTRRGRARIISPYGMLDPWALRYSAWKKAHRKHLVRVGPPPGRHVPACPERGGAVRDTRRRLAKPGLRHPQRHRPSRRPTCVPTGLGRRGPWPQGSPVPRSAAPEEGSREPGSGLGARAA
jgi:hypothetical protein